MGRSGQRSESKFKKECFLWKKWLREDLQREIGLKYQNRKTKTRAKNTSRCKDFTCYFLKIQDFQDVKKKPNHYKIDICCWIWQLERHWWILPEWLGRPVGGNQIAEGGSIRRWRWGVETVRRLEWGWVLVLPPNSDSPGFWPKLYIHKEQQHHGDHSEPLGLPGNGWVGKHSGPLTSSPYNQAHKHICGKLRAWPSEGTDPQGQHCPHSEGTATGRPCLTRLQLEDGTRRALSLLIDPWGLRWEMQWSWPLLWGHSNYTHG